MANWIKEILDLGTITRQELGSLIGKLSFLKTSIFGSICRSIMAPPHGMHNSPNPHPLISEMVRMSLQWRVMALPDMKPRIAGPQAEVADATVFTNAATQAMIVAAVTMDGPLFTQNQTVADVRSETLRPYWGNLFDETNLIYGMGPLSPSPFYWGGTIA